MVDAIISNPPFVPRKLFWDFHCKAMAVSRHSISWLINIISLNVFTPVRLLEIQSRGWYVQKLHVVADKRWFGRYVLMTFSREPSDVLTSHRETF